MPGIRLRLRFIETYQPFQTWEILEETDLNGERHFRMQCDPGVHHHHFICTACGKTRSIPHCPMEMITVNLPDYEVEGHKFEIYGKCPDWYKNPPTLCELTQ